MISLWSKVDSESVTKVRNAFTELARKARTKIDKDDRKAIWKAVKAGATQAQGAGRDWSSTRSSAAVRPALRRCGSAGGSSGSKSTPNTRGRPPAGSARRGRSKKCRLFPMGWRRQLRRLRVNQSRRTRNGCGPAGRPHRRTNFSPSPNEKRAPSQRSLAWRHGSVQP